MGNGGSTAVAPIFFAPFTTSIVPAQAAGSSTPSFFRASTAYVQDHEGVQRQVLANEARFWGARRVFNYDQKSDFSSSWTRVSGLIHPDPFGGNSAVLMTTVALTAYGSFSRSSLDAAWPTVHTGRTLCFSFYVKAGTATHVGLRLGSMGTNGSDQYVTFNLATGVKQDQAGTAATYNNAGAINVGNGWWRVWMVGISTVALVANDVALFNNAGGDTTSATQPSVTAYLYGHQVEDVSGQSVQTPAEYVEALARASSPTFPANVDGVRYFGTTLAGVPIPATTLLGYVRETSGIQLVTPTAAIRDMSSTWTLGATLTRSANSQIGVDGVANTATRLTGGAVAGTNTIQLLIAGAASSRTYSCFMRRVTGTGQVRLFQGASFSPDLASQLTGGNWVRVQFNASVDVSIAPGIGIQIDTLNDVVDVDFNQFEAGARASTPMASTGSSRNSDDLSYVSTNNVSSAAGTAYIETAFINADSVAASGDTTLGLLGTTNARVFTYDGGGSMCSNPGAGNVGTTLGTIAVGTSNKFCNAWVGSTVNGSRNVRNGAAGVLYTAPAAGMGNGITTLSLASGTYLTAARNLRIYSQTFTPAQQDAMVA